MGARDYIKVDDIITRSPHLSERFKTEYRNEVRTRRINEFLRESGKVERD